MRGLTKHERVAVEAVARGFSATWELKGSGGVYLMVGGKRVDVDLRTLKQKFGGGGGGPRLRFDKVATRVMERLRSGVGEKVPAGVTVLVTLTAPIRLPGKTVMVLEERIRGLLGRGLRGRDVKERAHGNGVRIRLWRGGSERAPRVIGFVHNSDTDSLRLLNVTCELLKVGGDVDARRGRRLAGDRWLVVISAERQSRLDVYRYIYSQLKLTSGYKKVVMVFGDGRVELLAG